MSTFLTNTMLPPDNRSPAQRANDERRAALEALDHRPSAEKADRELADVMANAVATAAPVRAEADRLAEALKKATAEHGQATADTDRHAAALEAAIIDGADVAGAEKKLSEAPGKVKRLAHRVGVLRDAAERAAKDADEAEEVAFNKLCWARLPAAKDAVLGAEEALGEFDRQAAAERETFLRALADATVLANRLQNTCVPSRSISNGVEREVYATGIEQPATT